MGSLLVGVVAVALLSFLAVHVVLLVGLARHKPRYQALVALAVPPLAPYWAWRAGARRAVWIWGAALVLYAVAVTVILR